jgi:hypothetical protein
MEQAIIDIPDNVASALRGGSNTPLARRLLELAAIQAHEDDLITEQEVMEMLSFEDREELWEFFKRYDVRSKHTNEDFNRESAALEELLSHHN